MSERYTFTGRVVHIGDVQEFGSNGFYKRDLVLSDEADKYPQEVCFECAKDNADKAGELEAGDRVTVSFDLRGREWKGRWFNSLNAWKIETVGGQAESRKQDAPKRELPTLDEEDDDSQPPF